jgi:AhpD family alkylhydroperoxidase
MNRISIKALEPKGYEAMLGLEAYLRQSPLKKPHIELIKIRASQINGCAFCLGMHTYDARKAGETEQRIYALNAWEESPLYNEEERALLALTDAVTLIADTRLPDDAYARVAAVLDEHYLAAAIMAIVTINAWNRIAISTRMVWQDPE